MGLIPETIGAAHHPLPLGISLPGAGILTYSLTWGIVFRRLSCLAEEQIWALEAQHSNSLLARKYASSGGCIRTCRDPQHICLYGPSFKVH